MAGEASNFTVIANHKYDSQTEFCPPPLWHLEWSYLFLWSQILALATYRISTRIDLKSLFLSMTVFVQI